MDFSRRTILTSALGPAAATALTLRAPATLASTSSAARRPFDPSNIKESTRGFLKLSGSLGSETVRMWFTGKAYAYFPGEPVQELFYMDGFYLTDYRANEDGTHVHERYEITTKRDIETGNLLKTYENPFTGRTDKVVSSIGGPQYKIYNDWGFSSKLDVPKGPDDPHILEWMVFDDDAWLTWDLFLRFKNPLNPEKHPLAYSGDYLDLVNLTNYKGKLSDLENPEVLNAPGVMFWNGISSWQPWMRMGQTPGSIVYKTIGVKLARFEDVPKQVFDAAEKAFPGCLTEKVPWPEGNYPWADFADEEWGDK